MATDLARRLLSGRVASPTSVSSCAGPLHPPETRELLGEYTAIAYWPPVWCTYSHLDKVLGIV